MIECKFVQPRNTERQFDNASINNVVASRVVRLWVTSNRQTPSKKVLNYWRLCLASQNYYFCYVFYAVYNRNRLKLCCWDCWRTGCLVAVQYTSTPSQWDFLQLKSDDGIISFFENNSADRIQYFPSTEYRNCSILWPCQWRWCFIDCVITCPTVTN